MKVTKRQAIEELARRSARTNLLSFMKWCWWMPHKFVVGKHTVAICNRLTKATEDWRNGKSTYLLISVPFRHGKSDIVSRALPAWFLGRNKDMHPDVILSGYGFSLVQGFSRWIKRILDTDRYQDLFPGVYPSKGENKSEEWRIEGSAGAVVAQGLGGSLTGKGGHLIIVDDYCKNREEAASQTYRNNVWDGFRNDLFTRQNAPASIVIVCATPWHVDDLRGRIHKAMQEDEDFPRFEEISFPARKMGEYEYLFPERFTPDWYDAQRASLKKQASALLDCNPIVEGGNRFDVSKVVVHKDLNEWPEAREVRGWDLASSSKERDKDDPDWTWGIRGCKRTIDVGHGLKRNELWIRSMVAIRAEAPERDALMLETAKSDGCGVVQYVEAFGAYKDAFTTLKRVLHGVSVVKASRLQGDKSAKLASLEPSFDSGDVHVYYPDCAKFFDAWKADFSSFPDGKHDDACDATGVLYHALNGESGSTILI